MQITNFRETPKYKNGIKAHQVFLYYKKTVKKNCSHLWDIKALFSTNAYKQTRQKDAITTSSNES